MGVPRQRSSFWGQDCNCHVKGEEETQPRLLGSTPIPPGKPLLLEKSQSPVQVPSITPVQTAAPLHSKPSRGTSGTPQPKAPHSHCRQGRGTWGLGRQLGSRRSSPNAEVPQCSHMTLCDCRRETSSTGVAQGGKFTSPGGNTQRVCAQFHPDLWIRQHPEPGNVTETATAPHLVPHQPFKSTVPHNVSSGEKQEHPQEPGK